MFHFSPNSKARQIIRTGMFLLILAGSLLLPGSVSSRTDPGDCWSKIFHAIQQGNLEEIKKLENEQCDYKHAESFCGGFVLTHFLDIEKITAGHEKILKYLISRGMNINAMINDNRYKKTYIIILSCSAGRDKRLTRILIDNGADVKVRNGESGDTVLHAAVMGQDLEMVRLLIDKGVDVNARDKSGQTPLINCGTNGGTEPDIARLLIDRGAKIDAQCSDEGFSALILAASIRHNELVKVLLEKGAKVNLKNKRGSTALDYATANGHEDTVAMLKKYGARKGRPVKSRGM